MPVFRNQADSAGYQSISWEFFERVVHAASSWLVCSALREQLAGALPWADFTLAGSLAFFLLTLYFPRIRCVFIGLMGTENVGLGQEVRSIGGENVIPSGFYSLVAYNRTRLVIRLDDS